MGFNTVAVIYNDHVHRLAQDGCFGAAVARAIQYWPARTTDQQVTNFGAGMIVSQDHADNSQVVIVGQNSGQMAREATNLDPWALRQMAECLERHGYKVTKPRKVAKPEAVHPRSVHAAYHEWALRNGRDFPLNAATVVGVIADVQRAGLTGMKRRKAIQARMEAAASGIEAPSGRQDAPAAWPKARAQPRNVATPRHEKTRTGLTWAG